jgi:predicted phage terminase large subunit-like protein
VASKGEDGRYYIRHCEGYQMSPDKWATEVVKLYKKYNATKIVAETNNGGDMVENTIRHVKTYVNGGRSYNVDAYTIPIEKIHAKKGKLLRAEEVALLYEQRRVTHVSVFSELESQMIVFKGEPNGADDLVDAMVYAIKELAGVREIEAYAPQVIGQGLVSDRLILL